MNNYLWCVMCVNPVDESEFVWGIYHDGHKAEAACIEKNDDVKNHSSGEYFYCLGKEAGDTPGSYTKEQILAFMWRVRDELEEEGIPISYPNISFEALAERLEIEGY
jgi:hypothetical protein